MTFDVARVLAHASAAMTLEPGDLVLTGTPAGVFPVEDGDRVSVSIDGLVALEHGVAVESGGALDDRP
jgi:2-keto-4-pentenoate hydratase/2-oxohepta-3-ene-1,7-dioic acid hydratase in catechol pathway